MNNESQAEVWGNFNGEQVCLAKLNPDIYYLDFDKDIKYIVNRVNGEKVTYHEVQQKLMDAHRKSENERKSSEIEYVFSQYAKDVNSGRCA